MGKVISYSDVSPYEIVYYIVSDDKRIPRYDSDIFKEARG